MDPTIRVKLDVEGMRYHVVHAFTQHELQLAKVIDQEIVQQIAAFDFQKEITEQVRVLMPQLVADALKSAVSEILRSSEVRSELHEIATSAVNEFIQQRKG